MNLFRSACLLAVLTALVSSSVVKQDDTAGEVVKTAHQSNTFSDSFAISIRTITLPVLTYLSSLPLSTKRAWQANEPRDEAHEKDHHIKRAESTEDSYPFDDRHTKSHPTDHIDTASADLITLFNTALSKRDKQFNNNFLNCNFNAAMTNWCRNHFGYYCTSAGKRQQTKEYTGRKSQICEDDCQCHRIASINDCLRQYIPLSICVGASADIIKAMMDTDEHASPETIITTDDSLSTGDA